MGPVERAIRATYAAPVDLTTFGQAKPFVLSAIEDEGIVFLLGRTRSRTTLPWDSLESIPGFLRGRPGWVRAGGIHSVRGEPGTLDEHLKRWQKTDVARWLTRVLAEAGIVLVRERPALSLRLSDRFTA